MKTIVTEHVHGFSNSHLRIPFAYAQTKCGHGVKSEQRPKPAPAGYVPDPTLPGTPCFGYEDILPAIGAEVECERCDWQVTSIAQLKTAIAAGIVSHSRADRHWAGRIHVYRYDKTSPTGVMHLLSLDETPEACAVLRGGLSPLSPTERR
jgi:hypothetical protein